MSTYRLSFDQRSISCQADETVLDALLRENVDIPHACRQGACQSCLIRSIGDTPPPAAQNGLKDVLRHRNFFLACLCYPRQDMKLDLHSQANTFTSATVIEKQMLNAETLQLTLQCHEAMDYYAGQFVNLRRADGLMRSYSIANNRLHADKLSFHIRRLAGGRFSQWAHRELNVGDEIEVSDPQGLCYYLPGDLQQNLLLIGTGSGLAPLAGIASEALHQGHAGNIYLYHGSRHIEGLYWVEEMRQLAEQHGNFHYTPCVSGNEIPNSITQGRANEIAFAALPDLKGWRIYLCGHPEMVNDSKRQAFLQGASLQQIYSDAFHVASATLD